MKVLSKKIKIPQKGDDVQSYDFPTRQWENESYEKVKVFYKDEDSLLLENKWGIIIISLETIFKRLTYSSGTLGEGGVILFTEGKRKLESVYLIFIDIENEKYVQKALTFSFKEYRKLLPSSLYVIKLNFNRQIFGFSSFYLVEQCSGGTGDKRITWFKKESKAILPVKFSNKNSNGIIDLGDILYKTFLSNIYDFSQNPIAHLEKYEFFNFVSNERYCLKDIVTMSESELNFFNNMNIKGILLKNSNMIIFMEDGSSYFISLNQ